MWFAYCFPALVIAGAGVYLYHVAYEDWRWWVVPALLGLTAFLYCFFYFFQRWNLRRVIGRQLKSNPAAQGIQRYSISEAGIGMTGSLHNLDLKWEAIIKAVESRYDFFLYFSKVGAYFLPKTALANEHQQEELRRLLKTKLGERARLNQT